MAVFISGESKCGICGKIINPKKEEWLGFPDFIPNMQDPIFFVSDGTFHTNCISSHPHVKEITRRFNEFDKNYFGRRLDLVSGEEIQMKDLGHPDNYLFIGHLTSDEGSVLYSLNYSHINLNNFSNYEQRQMLIDELKKLDQSDTWYGPYLKEIIFRLEKGPVNALPKAMIERLEAFILDRKK